VRGESGNLGFVDDAAKRVHATVTGIRDRAARVEEGLRQGAAGLDEDLRQRVVAVERGLQPRAAVTGGTVEPKNPDLAAVQASLRSVISYIQKNPLPAALLALGAGVIATSIWSERNGATRPRSRGRR
jgi:hypothetical protein